MEAGGGSLGFSVDVCGGSSRSRNPSISLSVQVTKDYYHLLVAYNVLLDVLWAARAAAPSFSHRNLRRRLRQIVNGKRGAFHGLWKR